jgi:hypothetical protein
VSAPTQILSFEASAATTAFRIARYSEAATTSRVANAAAATDPIVGVFGEVAHDAGDMADVIVSGLCDVEAGGTITAGALLTADAQGRAIVVPAPTATSHHRVVGVATMPGVVGDRIKVLVAQSIQRAP